jgi:tetratricopeptide (TPR) repeat protein
MSVASSADGSESSTEVAPDKISGSISVSNVRLRCTIGHQGYTLVGVAFVIFEIGFLILYSNEFWFNLDIGWLGIPAALLAMGIAHLLLCWAESQSGCNFFAPIWKRRPPIVYRQWLRLNQSDLEPGLSFGQRHVVWRAIDEVQLTVWGNLRILSRALSGAPSAKPPSKIPFFRAVGAEEILKFPFGVATVADQKLVIDAMRQNNPALKVNDRLTKRLEAKEVKGTKYVQQLGAIFLFFVLMDVGFSMYNYLEMLKNYYLCQSAAISELLEVRKLAPKFFYEAELIQEHPLPFSWVSTKIMREGKVASGLFQTRAEALWAIGRKDEAITSMRKSLELSPNSFRINLRLARMMALADHRQDAIAQLDEAMKNHESALLPRLYSLALHPTDERSRFYKVYLHDLDDELFGNDLMWPPGSHVFLQDVFYRDDLTFIFDKLLDTDTSGIRGTGTGSKSKKHDQD